MKTCAVCEEQVSSRDIRQGAAIARGAEVYHRDCHRAIRATPSPSPSSAPSSSARVADGTSFPEIGTAPEYASFWRRLGAHVIDGVVLNIVVLLVTFPLGMMLGMSGADPSIGAVLGGLVGFTLPLAYFIWFWSKKGATPGKLALGVRVVARDGGTPTATQSFIRYLGYIPSSLFFCIGFLWMLWDDEKRTWHDMMAGTHVIRG